MASIQPRVPVAFRIVNDLHEASSVTLPVSGRAQYRGPRRGRHPLVAGCQRLVGRLGRDRPADGHARGPREGRYAIWRKRRESSGCRRTNGKRVQSARGQGLAEDDGHHMMIMSRGGVCCRQRYIQEHDFTEYFEKWPPLASRLVPADVRGLAVRVDGRGVEENGWSNGSSWP